MYATMIGDNNIYLYMSKSEQTLKEPESSLGEQYSRPNLGRGVVQGGLWGRRGGNPLSRDWNGAPVLECNIRWQGLISHFFPARKYDYT